MRLIDADAMLETLKRKYPQWYTGKPKDNWMHYAWLVYHWAVENAPTIDATPIRHGRWEPYSIEPEAYDIAGVKSWAKKYRCSECRFIHTVIEDFGIYTFCPNCGAFMDKDGDGNEID